MPQSSTCELFIHLPTHAHCAFYVNMQPRDFSTCTLHSERKQSKEQLMEIEWERLDGVWGVQAECYNAV